MKEAVNEDHEGKRKAECTWKIHRIHWEKNRFIYDLMYVRKVMSRELVSRNGLNRRAHALRLGQIAVLLCAPHLHLTPATAAWQPQLQAQRTSRESSSATAAPGLAWTGRPPAHATVATLQPLCWALCYSTTGWCGRK